MAGSLPEEPRLVRAVGSVVSRSERQAKPENLREVDGGFTGPGLNKEFLSVDGTKVTSAP
jgi:hypothetical protein